jgi:RNA polymerase primary sigma factor
MIEKNVEMRAALGAAKRAVVDVERALLDTYRPFVEGIVKAFQEGSLLRVETEDLLQEGLLGLHNQMETYRLAFGVSFKYYAYGYVRALVANRAEVLSNGMRLGRRRIEQMKGVEEAICNRGSVRALARALSLSRKDARDLYHLLLLAPFCPLPLSAALPDRETPSMEDLLMRKALPDLIGASLATLKPRVRDVLIRYFGLKDAEPMTMRAIGCEKGVTRERIRQMRNSGLKDSVWTRNRVALQQACALD